MDPAEAIDEAAPGVQGVGSRHVRAWPYTLRPWRCAASSEVLATRLAHRPDKAHW